MRLNYAIKFASDMDLAVAFYRDTLGLSPTFQSPFWSEFDTGETKLAAGSVHASAQANGITFTSPSADIHGSRIARFRDLDGAEISISGS
jgi:predicted enzyme related to lactoylglutathione lyase